MDRVVLSNQEIGIKESLKKYIPIICTDTVKSRSLLQEQIDEMYKYRSDYIHHGECAVGIGCEKLCSYNFIVFNLIIVLIELRERFKTLKELRDHIDEQILSVKLNLQKEE